MIHTRLEGLVGDTERIARVAVAAYDLASLPSTAPSGTASYDNGDGTRTVIGPQAGGRTIATHVGDLTPPGRPLGVAGASSAGVVYIAWGGELEGGVPDDFDHVSLYMSVEGTSELVGTLTEAGIVSTVPMATTATVEVWATAEDDACLADGTPAHNVSQESDHATVKVTQAEDKAAVDALRDRLSNVEATADGLTTLIREGEDGITVGKSADGKTYSTGRTRMGEDSFDVLDKAGKVLSSFGASLVRLGTNAAAILLAGILRVESLQTHPATAGGSQQTIDTGRISVPVHAEVGTPWSAIELAGRDDTSGVATTALRAEFSVDGRDGSIQPYVYVDCGMTVDGTLLMSDEASTLGTRKGLRISQGSKVCTGHGTPWVTLFESWSEFQSTTGCYDSGLPTLVTMNGDWGAFDGALSDCEIRGGDAVYVMARTTDGPHTLYSSNRVRINWICIW